jgi:hypothetical protein
MDDFWGYVENVVSPRIFDRVALKMANWGYFTGGWDQFLGTTPKFKYQGENHHFPSSNSNFIHSYTTTFSDHRII